MCYTRFTSSESIEIYPLALWHLLSICSLRKNNHKNVNWLFLTFIVRKLKFGQLFLISIGVQNGGVGGLGFKCRPSEVSFSAYASSQFFTKNPQNVNMAKKCIFIEKFEILRPVYVIIGVQNGYECHLRFNF